MYITNKTEFDYKLNIYAATMLMYGINDYFKGIRKLHKEGIENDDYLDMMLFTAKLEAERLLKWMKKIKPRKSPLGVSLVSTQIEDLKVLLYRIGKFRERINPY